MWHVEAWLLTKMVSSWGVSGRAVLSVKVTLGSSRAPTRARDPFRGPEQR